MKRIMLSLVIAALPGVMLAAPAPDALRHVAQAGDACLRHDFSKMQELVAVANQAIEAQDRALLKETATAMRQCMVFEVSFRSSLVTTTGELISTITGTGTATLKLGPDLQEAGYDFVSSVNGVTAPMVWSGVAMKSKDCTTVIIPSPPTPYNFWLAMSFGKKPSGLVSVSQDSGTELHLVTADCNNSATGVPLLDALQKKPGKGVPTPTPMFSESWGVLYGAIDATSDPEDAMMIPLTVTPVPGQAVVARYTAARRKDMPGAQGTVQEQTTIIVTHRPGAQSARVGEPITMEP